MESNTLTWILIVVLWLPPLTYILARTAALGYYRGRQAYREQRRKLNGERRKHKYGMPERRLPHDRL